MGVFRVGHPTVDSDEILEAVCFDPATGKFFWTLKPNKRISIGSEVGTIGTNGYRQTRYKGNGYLLHRVAFRVCNGTWPKRNVDHINGNPSNNRPENLRECDQAENLANISVKKNNTSGYPGVCFDRAQKKWVSRINVRNRRVFLGAFLTPEAGYAAYLRAKAIYHPFCPSGRNLPSLPTPKMLNPQTEKVRA